MSDQNFDIRIRTTADTAGLRAVEDGLRDVRAEASKASNLTGEVAAGSFLGGLAAGVVQEATSQLRQHIAASIELADRLADLSAKAGVTGEDLQVLGNAASLNGGSIDGMANSLAFLNRTSAAARAGNEAAAEAFARLGVSLQDLATMSPDQVMMRIADSVSTASDRSRAYADVVIVAGRESGNLFATLEQGSATILASGRAMGVFGEATQNALAQAKDDMDGLNNQITIWAGKLAAAVMASGKHIGEGLAYLLEPPVEQHLIKLDQAGASAAKSQAALGDAMSATAASADEEAEALNRAARGLAAMQAEMGKGIEREENAEAAAFRLKQEAMLIEARTRGETGRARQIEDALAVEDEYNKLRRAGVDDAAKAMELAERLVGARRAEKDAAQQTTTPIKQIADDSERAAEAAERAREALEDVEGDFEGVDARGAEGVRARARARGKFTRQQQRAAAEAAEAGVPAADIARQTKENEDRFNQDMRAARGRFGGSVASPSGADVTGGGRFDRYGNRIEQAAQKTDATAQAATSGAAAEVDKGAQASSGAARELASAATNYQQAASELSAAAGALRSAFHPMQKAIQQLRSDVDSLKPMQGSGN